MPGVLRLLSLGTGDSILDLACGQGVLGRQLPEGTTYHGFDIAPGLIRYATMHDKDPHHRYTVADVTKNLPIDRKDFTHAACILALQNMQHPDRAVENAAAHLRPGGVFVIVLNHPCFRIPRQSSWETDEKQHLQYRRINRYMSPLEIPISAAPSRGKKSPVTWSFHLPISAYAGMLANAGFLIERLEEWISDKKSEGGAAAREDRSRREFPLFLAIKASKRS